MADRSPPRTTHPNLVGWALACLTLAYAAVLAYATHHPRPDSLVPGVSGQPDKLLHFAAYGILGCLATTTLVAFRGRPRWWVVVGLFVVLSGLAAVDEATQPMFGRAAEPLDWVFDLCGIAIGGLAAGVAVRILAIFGLFTAESLT